MNAPLSFCLAQRCGDGPLKSNCKGFPTYQARPSSSLIRVPVADATARNSEDGTADGAENVEIVDCH